MLYFTFGGILVCFKSISYPVLVRIFSQDRRIFSPDLVRIQFIFNPVVLFLSSFSPILLLFKAKFSPFVVQFQEDSTRVHFYQPQICTSHLMKTILSAFALDPSLAKGSIGSTHWYTLYIFFGSLLFPLLRNKFPFSWLIFHYIFYIVYKPKTKSFWCHE